KANGAWVGPLPAAGGLPIVVIHIRNVPLPAWFPPRTMSCPSMIHVSNLTKYYGDYAAIQDVSFEVPAGQIVGFLGPNGAGKTTTMRILAGFLTATSGKASIA